MNAPRRTPPITAAQARADAAWRRAAYAARRAVLSQCLADGAGDQQILAASAQCRYLAAALGIPGGQEAHEVLEVTAASLSAEARCLPEMVPSFTHDDTGRTVPAAYPGEDA